jgi:hypothetical protein
MRSILLVGTTVTMVIAMASVASFGIGLAPAQMADNATMGNMTGSNMTSGNTAEETGSISSTGDSEQNNWDYDGSAMDKLPSED